jgi:hypothetical protein
MIGTVGSPARRIGVQRMRRAALHGPACRDQRLADHLTSEHALPAYLRAEAAEKIHLERFDVEDGQELFERAAHVDLSWRAPCPLAGSRSRRNVALLGDASSQGKTHQ